MENERLGEVGIQQSESIKLSKMSKGYNWEIKLLEIDLDRLEKLNNDMVERFGSGD